MEGATKVADPEVMRKLETFVPAEPSKCETLDTIPYSQTQELASELLEIMEQQAELKARGDKIRKTLYHLIGEGNSFLFKGNRFTVVSPQVTTKFDSKKFKNDCPELYVIARKPGT